MTQHNHKTRVEGCMRCELSAGEVKHDYEPGDMRHPMYTDPLCRICGGPKKANQHA